MRVFYQVWDRPLITVNGDHVISKAMRLCGGENVLAALPASPRKSTASWCCARSRGDRGQRRGRARPAWLDDWKAFPALAAVRQANLYAIRPELLQRHTPRLLEGAEELCRILEAVRLKRKHSEPPLPS